MGVQTYIDLKQSIEKINNLIENKPCFVQKVYSSSYWLHYALRIPGESINLLQGRGNHFEALIINRPIESKYRRKDKLLDFLRKNVRGACLKKIVLDKLDRAFCYELIRDRKKYYFAYFYGGRKSYFIFRDEKKTFLSWRGKIENQIDSIDTLFKLFDDVGRKDILKTKQGSFGEIDWSLEERNIFREDKKKSKKKIKKKQRIEQDLLKIKERAKLKEALEGVNELEDGKVNLAGFNINLGYGLSFYEKRDLVYRKVKKLKKAESIQEERLKNLETDKSDEQSEIQFKKSPILPEWNESKKEIILTSSSQIYKEIKDHKYHFLNGLTAQGNDLIRKKSKKNDWWYHLEANSSAHIIVSSNAYFNPTDEILLQKVVELIVINQAFREVDLIYTQVKNLRSVKGSAGKVRFSKERRVRVIRSNS